MRVPLHGRTTIPVRTRRQSNVQLTIAGDPTVYERSSGRKGRTKFRVIVPPGPDAAQVVVTDRKGLRTEKRVPIRRGDYNRLALTAQPTADKTGFAIAVALAEPDAVTLPELIA